MQSDGLSDDTSQLAQVRSDLAQLHLVRFQSRSNAALRVAPEAGCSPHVGPYHGWEEDLNYAIANFEELERLYRARNRALSWDELEQLSVCYSSRFNWLGDTEDIKRGIGLCRNALTESSPSDEFYPGILFHLAEWLSASYVAHNCSDDLHEAITYMGRVLELCPDNTKCRRQRAGMYHSRFRIANNMSDLDAAISDTRICLDSTAQEDSDQDIATRLLARVQTIYIVLNVM